MNISSLKVDEFTSVDPITMDSSRSLIEIKDKMKSENIRHMPIIKSGELYGLVTDRDIRGLDTEQIHNLSIDDVIIREPFTVQSTDLLKDVVFQMSEKKIGSALVLEQNGELYGIFTSIDALNTIIEMI